MRQPRLVPADLSDAQTSLYRSITEGPRRQGPTLIRMVEDDGALAGPFGGFLLSPRVGDALQRLGTAVRYESSLTDRLREMAILVVAHHWGSDFEREAHEAVGAAVGLSDDELRALADGRTVHFDDPREAACVTITRALVDGDITDECWQSCVPPLTAESIFELTTIVGYYSTLALQMRAFRSGSPSSQDSDVDVAAEHLTGVAVRERDGSRP